MFSGSPCSGLSVARGTERGERETGQGSHPPPPGPKNVAGEHTSEGSSDTGGHDRDVLGLMAWGLEGS